MVQILVGPTRYFYGQPNLDAVKKDKDCLEVQSAHYSYVLGHYVDESGGYNKIGLSRASTAYIFQYLFLKLISVKEGRGSL